MVNRPSFFKFYIPELNAKSLKIPPMFVRSIHGNLPENVVLRDRYNNLWHVKLDKIGNNWYFRDGLTKFVHDNMIKGGNVLLFDYFCEGLFDFKIFGSSACEEKGVGGHMYKNIEEQYKMIESHVDIADDSDGDDYAPSTKQEKLDDCPRGGQVADVGSSTSAHGSKRNCDWYGAAIFRSGLIPQPVNPYFVTNTRRNRTFELYIPMDVVKGYCLQLPETIMLVDPTGRKFHSKRKIWKDGRVVLKGGWKTLCAVNLVGKDDSCICEFIQPKGEHLYLSVSFFRANKLQR